MKHLDLCSGIGGFALAARWMGWETVGFAEIDPFCGKILEKHWPGVLNFGDIATVPGGIRADIVTAGIPCQPYSCAGKRLGSEDDRAIWPLTFEVVRSIRPRWIVLENVAGFVGMALDGVLSDLEAEGYEARAGFVPACAVNAPHQRERLWVIAHDARRADRANHAGAGGGQVQQLGKRSGEAVVSDAALLLRQWPADQQKQGRAEIATDGFFISDSARVAKRKPADEINPFATERATRTEPSGARAAATDADRKGLERRDGPELRERPDKLVIGQSGTSVAQITKRLESNAQPGIRGTDDGLSGGMDRFGSGPEFWDGGWTRGTPPVSVGVKNRTGRLKALGNSIVPQVAYQIFKAISSNDEESGFIKRHPGAF